MLGASKLGGLVQLASNLKDLVHLHLKFKNSFLVSNQLLIFNLSGSQLYWNFLNRTKLNWHLVDIALIGLELSLQTVLA
jgi:hypothetical protein